MAYSIPLSSEDRAELRQQAASRIMVADDPTLLQIARPLGLLPRPAGHDAGKPFVDPKLQTRNAENRLPRRKKP